MPNLRGAEGVLRGSGEGGDFGNASADEELCSGINGWVVSEAVVWEDDLPWAGAVGSLWAVSLGRPKAAKSVSLSGGAGADGEMVAFNGMEIGGREEAGNALVGAVDPVRSGLRAWGFPTEEFAEAEGASRLWVLAPLPSFPAPLFPPAPAATWAAFLFFLSIAMLWPGKTCASAHL